jgi:hypothetical protein
MLFDPDTTLSSTNETDRHDLTEILERNIHYQLPE